MESRADPGVDLAVLLPDLLAASLDGMPASGLSDGVRRLNALEAQVVARRAEYIAQAERTGMPSREGYSSTTAWLVAVAGEPGPVCRSRVAMAAALHEMPQTREAFAAGVVSESRVRLLAQGEVIPSVLGVYSAAPQTAAAHPQAPPGDRDQFRC